MISNFSKGIVPVKRTVLYSCGHPLNRSRILFRCTKPCGGCHKQSDGSYKAEDYTRTSPFIEACREALQ